MESINYISLDQNQRLKITDKDILVDRLNKALSTLKELIEPADLEEKKDSRLNSQDQIKRITSRKARKCNINIQAIVHGLFISRKDNYVVKVISESNVSPVGNVNLHVSIGMKLGDTIYEDKTIFIFTSPPGESLKKSFGILTRGYKAALHLINFDIEEKLIGIDIEDISIEHSETSLKPSILEKFLIATSDDLDSPHDSLDLLNDLLNRDQCLNEILSEKDLYTSTFWQALEDGRKEISKLLLKHSSNLQLAQEIEKEKYFSYELQSLKEILESAFDVFVEQYGQNNIQVALILKNLGSTYEELGEYKKAKECLKTALSIDGNDDIKVAEMKITLGQVLVDLSEHEEAKKLLEEVLKSLKEKHGIMLVRENVVGLLDHPLVISVMVSLSNAYGGLGECTKQKEILEEVLSIFQILYPNSYKTNKAIILGNLCGVCSRIGDFDLLKQYSAQLIECLNNSNIPEVLKATILMNLGSAYSDLGRYRESENIYEQACKILKESCGERSPKFAQALVNLGTIRRQLSNLDQSKENLEKALKIQKDYYGLEHFELVTASHSLGCTYKALLEYGKAFEHLNNAEKILSKYHGDKGSPELAVCKGDLADLYVQSSRYIRYDMEEDEGTKDKMKKEFLEQSKKHLEEALKFQINYYGHDNNRLSITYRNLGNCYIEMSEGQDSQSLYESLYKSLFYLERAFMIGEEFYKQHRTSQDNLTYHPEIAYTMASLSTAYKNLGYCKLSIAVLEDALKIQKKCFGYNSVDVADILYNIMGTYFNLKDYSKTKKKAEEAASIYNQHSHPRHEQVLDFLNNLSSLMQGASSMSIKEVNDKDKDGCTLLHIASYKNLEFTTKLLLKNGADPTLVTNKGNTPLHMASNKGNNEIVRLLLENIKPDKLSNFINAQTILGGTSALHVASDIKVTRSLLQYGAVYNIKNKKDKTPLDLAKNDDIRKLLSFTNELFEDAQNGNLHIISKLDNLEADDFLAVTNARNDQGHTLLQVAIANKHRDIEIGLSEILRKEQSSGMESTNVESPSSSFDPPYSVEPTSGQYRYFK